MTCKIKRRSLRCGGRPKADFGSLFTSVIAPALNATGSIVDESIDNNKITTNGVVNKNTIIPSDPTKTPTMRLGGRKKCWIGTAIGAATSIAGSLFGGSAKKREMRRQKSIKDWQNTTQEAANMTTALNNSQDYQEDYLRQFRTAARLGKTLGAKGIYITDGGDATKIGNNTYLLRGGSHEDVNETGQTGIGINVGGNEVEAEGGEVAQKKNGALRIFSAQPILGNGMSPAQAILRGYNKDVVFKQQQAFKKRNGLKDDGSKDQIGGYYGANYPSPLSLLSVIYDKTLGRFDNKNPFLQTGTPPIPSRGLNLKQVRSGLVSKNMMPTNRVYRITNMREVKDAKTIGQYRKLPEGVRLPKKTVVSKNGRTFSIGKVGGNIHGGKAAAMGEPWTGTTSGGYNESKYVISTPSRHTVWQVGHHGSYSKPLPADAIKKGSGLWKKFDAEGNTGISTKRMVVYKDLGNGRYLRLAKSKYRLGGRPKAAFGNIITMPFTGIVKDVVDYFSNSGKYAPKRVKVSNKTVNRKPIRNGQVDNFRVVNGKYFPNEKPLRQVYPEFDVISIGRGLPIKRSLKNTVGFVQKPNTFTRGIGNREGIKDLVESKVVRGNPVGTEMMAKAYTKATKSNRNNFNDIMNGTGIEGISHRYYNRSLSKEDFDAIRESYNKINASFKARHPKASGKIRFAIGDDVYDPLGNYKNYDDYLTQIASDRKTLRNATTINPDNGEPIEYFYNDGRNPLTQGHSYASSKWGVRISNPQDYNMKIFDGHLHYSNSKTIPFDSPNVEVFRSTPFDTIRYPKWMLRRGWYRNGGLTSKDRGSSKHPYPSVSSKDFAGGGRSYPIPTKADAVDALRLAGLHGRSDVKSKVYSKYPSLRKKSLLGSCSRPVKGMRPKADTGIFVPYNKRYNSIYDAPDYSSDYNGGNVLGNGEVTVTAKRIKPTFMKSNNDAMNIINHPANETPYIPQRHNRSRTIFSNGDYLGLGIDTLAALSTGLVNYNTAGKYTLPDRAPIIQASKLPTTYNVNPEIEEVKRYRDRLTGQTFNNTSSSVAALNRSSTINLDALSNLSKLWATKENEENKMLTEDAKNQQTVAAQNVQNELARQSEIARIKNEAAQAKGNALNVGLSGLSQAWTNFWTAGRTAYEDDQARRAMIASSKDATPTRLMEMDFDLSPDVIAALYRGATEDRTKRFYLSRLSPKQRQKYGIN